MYKIEEMRPPVSSSFEKFIHPNYKRILHHTDASAIILGIKRLDTPIGIAAAKMAPDKSEAAILWIQLEDSQQRKGLGRKILETIENRLKTFGCQKVTMEYVEEEGMVSPITKIISRQSWSNPIPKIDILTVNTLKLKSNERLFQLKLPASYSIFPWSELTETERDDIHRGHDKWYPSILSPFIDEGKINHDYSIGLRYKGEVIGWLITQTIASNMLLGKTLFVKKEFQKRGTAISLLTEVIGNVIEKRTYEYAMSFIESNNRDMLNFIHRYFSSAIIKHKILYYTYKHLD